MTSASARRTGFSTAAMNAYIGPRTAGYLDNLQRRLREAYFVGIVTPATKHLRREIARLTRTTPEFSAQAVAA